MSVRVMAAVWDHSTTEGTDLLVLLALADHADHDGYAWPSVDRLAAKCRVHRATVFRSLQACEAAGELVRTSGGGRGQANLYRLTVVDNLSINGRTLRPLPRETVANDGQTVAGLQINRRTSATQNRQEPSIEPRDNSRVRHLGPTEFPDAAPDVGAKVEELRSRLRGPK
jgi:hypothetical protein